MTTLPPPPKKKSVLGDLINHTVKPADNMAEVPLKDMSFKVDPDFHHLFKTTASSYRLSMKELLEESFELWRKTKGL
jgi:hypothetical protein